MNAPAVIHNTFVIERSYPKPPATVFLAFGDLQKKRRWFTQGEAHDVEAFDLDFRIGGMERFRYRFREGTPFPGVVLSSETLYQDIIPNQRIVVASTMDLGEKRISASLVTFEFLSTETGTELICTHQGAFFEGADGPKMREGGWRQLFESLAKELANSSTL